MAKNKRNQKNITVLQPIAGESQLTARLPLIAVIAVLIAWTIFVLQHYLQAYPFAPFQTFSAVFSIAEYPPAPWDQIFSVWLGHLTDIIFVILFFISLFGWGSIIDRKSEYNVENNLFRFIFGIAIACAFLFTIGLLGVIYKLPIAIFIFIGLIFGFKFIAACWLDLKQLILNFKEKSYIAGLGIPVVLVLIGALSPETFYDSAVYHLGVPQMWINSHKLITQNSLLMTFYPSNVELLYTIGLMFRNSMAAKLMHSFLSLVTVILLFTMLQKYFSRRVAWIGALVFYCTPYVMVVSEKTNIEMALCLFETAAFFAIVNYLNNKEMKWLLISAVSSGLGMGAKYISVYSGFAIFAIIIIFRLFVHKEQVKIVLKEAFIYIFVASIVVSPWLIRNYIAIKNPFFPILYQYIGDLKLRGLGFFTDPGPRPLSLRNMIMLPWDFAMGKFNGRPIQEPFCGPVFLLFLPLFLLYKKHNKQINPFIVYSAIYVLIWPNFNAHFRLFVPALAVVSSVYAYWIGNITLAFVRKSLVILLIFASIGNIQLAATLQKYSENPYATTLGLVTAEQHLTNGNKAGSYVSPNYASVLWVNSNLPKDACILFLGETRGLFYERRFIINNVVDYIPIVEFTKASKNEDELADKLRKEGITHILLNAREVYRLKSYNIYYFNNDEWLIYQKFVSKYVKELYSKDWVFVYEILGAEEANKPHLPPHDYLSEIYLTKKI